MNRKKLLEILKKLKPGLADKEIVEAMTYVYFSGSAAVTYNDKISILHPLKTDFRLFVKADDLYRLVDKASAEELNMEEEGNFLQVSTKNMKVNLTTIIDEEIIDRIGLIEKSLKGVKWKKLPEDFINSASLTSFAADKSDGELTLSCIRIKGSKCEATDNDRYAAAKMSGPVDEMFIKASQLHNLAAIEPNRYVVTKAWVHFKNEDGCIFSIRKVDGAFPDFSDAIKFKGTKVQLSEKLLEGAEIASIFTDKLEPVVSLRIANNSCVIKVSSEGGKSQHRSKVKYTGEPIVFTLNPNFLKEMMSRSTNIVIDDEARRAKLATKNFIMLTSLLPSGE